MSFHRVVNKEGFDRVPGHHGGGREQGTADSAPGQGTAFGLLPEKLKLVKDVVDAMQALINIVQASEHLLPNHGGEDLLEKIRSEGGLTTWVQRYESAIIQRALFESKGNQRKAARLLGVKASTLNSKIHSLGIKYSHHLE